MHHRKKLLFITLCSFTWAAACGGESTTPGENGGVVLLDEDMSSTDPPDEGIEDQDPSMEDLSSTGCSENEFELEQDLEIGGESLAAGCYARCESSQDCQQPTPTCYDALSQPICVPENIPLPGPECGDGVVEGDEVCDGDCLMDATTCPLPQDSCMQAVLEGSSQTCDVVCSEAPIEACQSDDGCCPSGCAAANDNDCAPEQIATGAPCTSARDCIGDARFTGQGCFISWVWMDGYCSSMCESDDDCGGDGECLPTNEGSFCYDRCTNNSDCRDGYSCQRAGGSLFCGPVNGQGTTKAGDACQTHAQCGQGEYCQPHQTGFPDGFCSKPCRTSNDCNAGTRCVAETVPDNQTPLGFCSPSCTQDSQCRDGYGCLVGGACWPMASGTGEIGDACASRTDCAGGGIGSCVDDGYGFPDGYCTYNCQSDAECGESGHCSNQTCALSCMVDEDCPRSGYVCADGDADGRGECLPGGDGASEVGGACRNVSDCSGGFSARCINTFGSDPEWTAGYCTSQCSPEAACPSGSHCGNPSPNEQSTICLQTCQASADCRDGYSCIDKDQDGAKECVPRPTFSGP